MPEIMGVLVNKLSLTPSSVFVSILLLISKLEFTYVLPNLGLKVRF